MAGSRYSLDEIRRIRQPWDSLWNGAAIGAAIPLVIWAVACHGCPADAMLRNTLAASLIGATVDALHKGPRTLYEGPGKSASFAWRIRF